MSFLFPTSSLWQLAHESTQLGTLTVGMIGSRSTGVWMLKSKGREWVLFSILGQGAQIGQSNAASEGKLSVSVCV